MRTWKRIGYLFMIFVLLVTTILPALPTKVVKAESNFNNVVILNENFDDEAVGETPAGLDISEAGGSVTIAEDETGNKFVQLEDTSESDSVQISKSFEALTGIVTIQLKFKQPSYKSSAKVLRVKGDGISAIIETKDGHIAYRNSDDTYKNLIEVKEGQWYDVKLVVNLQAQTTSTYINDELKLENANFYRPATTINFIESFTPGNGAFGHHIDNLLISQQTEVEEEADPEGEIVFEKNFNEDVVGKEPTDVTVSEAGGTVSVVDLPSAENKSVYLEDTSEETNVILSKSFDDLVGTVTVDLKFMQPSYTSSTKIVRVKGDATPVIIETKNNSITYRTGDHYEPLVEVVENQWYNIKVKIDLDNQKANVFIDGELKLEEAALNESTTKVNFIETFTPNSSAQGHYVDDIRVAGFLPEEPTDPEPPEEPTDPEQDPDSDQEEPSESAGGIYEAEDAEVHHAIIDNKHVGFTGTGFVDYNPNAPGGWIEWTVEVPVDGEYTLDFRYAHGGTDKRPAEIKVNGEVVNPELAFDPTGDFAAWKHTSTKANLKAGVNTIRATGIAPSGGANIDHLRVFMEVDDTYEAEDAVFESDGVIVDNKHTGFTGTGFIDFSPNQPGSWVEWTVNVPADGEYYLDFRYGHGGTDSRPAEIKVNDQIIEEELAFDPTGGWAEWTYTTTKAELKAGENVIRATGVGSSGGANIDHLRVHNLADGGGEAPVEVEDSNLEEVAGGLLVKKMKQLGMIDEEPAANEEEITRLEFMALVNDSFGFVYEEKFKNLQNKENIWEVSREEWYAYVLEAAKEQGYADHLVKNDSISPDQTITKKEAAQMIENITGDTISTNNGSLTWGEAREWLSDQEGREIELVGVHAVSSNVMAVTLNGHFEEFDYNDLEVVVPTRKWDLLSPGFENLRIDKATHTTNKFGQTVVILHSLDDWNEYAEYEQEIEETKFSGNLDTAIEEANNLLTWQMEHGGWTKNWSHIYTRPWDGEESRSEWVEDGVELGTIDNDATISEIMYLAQVYQETKDVKYKESIEKGLEFLFKLQYDTGGFAQVYPERGNYSDYVTFNDEAMINVLEMMDLIVEQKYPFNSDLISEEYVRKTKESIDIAIDYILNAQIEVDGQLTAWCAQHDPFTYEPRGARSYEHPSISGSESVGIIRYLMSRPPTEEINRAILAALEWLDEVKLENTRYVSGDPNNEYFVEDPNSTAWYRFYEIGTNKPIFSGRDGVIKHDIMEIEEERRNGYAWGGHWGAQLLEIARKTGNYTNKVYVQVANTNSTDINGRTLEANNIHQLEGQMKQMNEIESHITVAKDGSGDYETVQAAIDAVPENNTDPVTIFIKNGIYKEVVTIPNNKPFITLLGESETDTIITYDNYAGRDNGVGGTLGTSGSASVYLKADDLTVQNLTLENSFDESINVEGNQAVAVYASGDRQYYRNVRFIGNQDTLYTHSGTQYYYQVYIEGDVDFIFGAASIVIEDSIIHSYDRGSDSNNGYVTAASTLLSEKYGMLILDSKFTSDAADGTVYLGRPWPAGGNPQARGSVLIKHSELGAHIKEEGWTSMSGLEPEDARLYEYENYGPGAVINENRRQLTDEEAAKWTVPNVLKGWDAQALNNDSGEENPDDGGEQPDDGQDDGDQGQDEEDNGDDNGSDQDQEEDNGDDGSDQDKDEEHNDDEGSDQDQGNDQSNQDGAGSGDNRELDEKIVKLGEKVSVAPGQTIVIEGSKVKIGLPDDLPNGTKLLIKEASPIHTDGFKIAGDIYQFDFEFPEGYEDYRGDYSLTLEYETSKFSKEEVAIYYYNEELEQWEHIGGEVTDGTITVTVEHFSTYGVLAEAEQASTGGTDHSNNELPSTATNTFNWIITSLLFLLLGSIILILNRKSKKS